MIPNCSQSPLKFAKTFNFRGLILKLGVWIKCWQESAGNLEGRGVGPIYHYLDSGLVIIWLIIFPKDSLQSLRLPGLNLRTLGLSKSHTTSPVEERFINYHFLNRHKIAPKDPVETFYNIQSSRPDLQTRGWIKCLDSVSQPLRSRSRSQKDKKTKRQKDNKTTRQKDKNTKIQKYKNTKKTKRQCLATSQVEE